MSSSWAMGNTMLVKVASEGLMSFASYSSASAFPFPSTSPNRQISMSFRWGNETHLIQQPPRPLTDLLRIIEQAILRRREQRGCLRRGAVLLGRHTGVRNWTGTRCVCRTEVVKEGGQTGPDAGGGGSQNEEDAGKEDEGKDDGSEARGSRRRQCCGGGTHVRMCEWAKRMIG